MAFLERYEQQPLDIKNYVLDYSQWLAVNEKLTSVVFKIAILNEQTGDVGEPTLSVNSVSLVNVETGVKYYVSGGLDGRRYQVTATAMTDDTQTYEVEVEFRIDEI
jgi:hypothetical protein